MIVVGVFLSLVFLFSLVSKRAQTTIITGPIVFTTAGMLLFFAAPEVAPLEIKNHTVLVLAEITLVVVLFGDATHLGLRQVMRETTIPARLLGIGMPLAIVVGTLIAVLTISDLTIWEAAILATILAPTDASLGAAVVNSRLVPERIRMALSVESGLNDGLSIPFLMLFVALANAGEHTQQVSWVVYTAQQIGFGLLVGLIVGLLGSFLMANAVQRNWVTKAAQQLALLSLAIISWWLAEKVIGGNGFIAAFVAGGMLRIGFEDAHERMAEFDEGWGDLLIYFVFFIFGTMAALELTSIPIPIWLYAVLSLTLIRMLPVGISLIGIRLQRASVLFLGWFGPRGLASIVLGLIYLEEATELLGNPIIVDAVVATVLLSVFAHGISTVPAIKRYSRLVAGLGPEAPECQETSVTPV